MDKPLSIILEESKHNIITCINEQNLQPCIMKYIIKDIYDMVLQASQKEYEKDKASVDDTIAVLEE